MTKRLTAKSIRCAMKQLEKGKSTSPVAAELGVTPRHMRRLRSKFKETEYVHVLRSTGGPALKPPSREEVQLVLNAYQLGKVGVLRTAVNLHRVGHNISCHYIMKDNSLVVPSETKSKKRKMCKI